MKGRATTKPQMPHDLTATERSAFDLYDFLHPLCQSKNCLLLIRVTGIGTGRNVVLELRKGHTSLVSKTRECATWFVRDQTLTTGINGAVRCHDSQRALALLMDAMDRRQYNRTNPKRDEPETLRPRTVHLHPTRKLSYLTEGGQQ